MSREISHRLSSPGSIRPPSQNALFPLDPWGAEQVFAVLDFPHPEIASVMIGPLTLGCTGGAADHSLHCLVASRNGDFVARITISSRHLQDETALWAEVAYELDRKRCPLLSSSRLRNGAIPEDCLEAWSTPNLWLSHPPFGDPLSPSVRALSKLLIFRQLTTTPSLEVDELIRIEHEAQAEILRQINDGLHQVLQALDPVLFEIVTTRPRISASMAYQLIAQAKPHGPSAVIYGLQALKTESLALLDLATSEYPEKESLQVRAAIFNGYSLPKSLSQLGIPKAAHKRSLRKTNNVPEQRHTDFSDLLLAGADWLTVMRFIKNATPQGADEWKEFCRLVASLSSLDFQQPETLPKLLGWCLACGHKTSTQRLDFAIGQALDIQAAAAGLAGLSLPLDKAASLALEEIETRLSPLDSDIYFATPGQLVRIVSQLLGQSMSRYMQGLFELQPKVPSQFHPPGTTAIRALNSLKLASEHGIACGICLSDSEKTIEYVADGIALYAVNVSNRVEGTIALRLFDSGESKPVEVWEVSGIGNSAPSPTLSALAQNLAASWSTEENLADWVAYANACEHWSLLSSKRDHHTSILVDLG